MKARTFDMIRPAAKTVMMLNFILNGASVLKRGRVYGPETTKIAITVTKITWYRTLTFLLLASIFIFLSAEK